MSSSVKKPNRGIERTAGIGGAILAAPWVVQGVLRIVDAISRAQTVMTVVPYLGMLTHPLAFAGEFLGAIGLLFYATRLEHYREAQEVPLIIRPWTEPERPKRHWFWLKLAIFSGSLSLVTALLIFGWLRYAPHLSKTVSEQKASLTEPTHAPPPQSPEPARAAHESPPHYVATPRPGASSKKEEGKVASDKVSPPTAPIIPVPDRQPIPKVAGSIPK